MTAVRRRAWMLAFGVLAAPGVFAATSPDSPPARPRLGLALGGGGARGLAHIGVLQVLEEERVPVDVIAGTSMGAIVGGLYASGVSSADLKQWVHSADWRDLLDDSPRRALRNFRSKEEDFDLPTAFEVGVNKDGIAMPAGMMTGQKLLAELRSLTLHCRHVTDFDQLPIPFRAVATNVETGATVVLSQGNLADSMRASMAVPGVFSPQTIDHVVLIDGFAASNLPISVARDLGATEVIAVNVTPPLRPASDLKDLLDYSSQLISILSGRDTAEQLKTLRTDDTLISCTAMPGSAADFAEGDKFIAAGYAAADAMRSELRRYSVSPEEYEAWRAVRFGAEKSRPHYIEFVRVKSDSRIKEEALQHRVVLRPGDALTPELLNESLMRVHAMGEFELVDYRLIEEDGKTGIEIDARKKSWGPNYLKLGFGVASDLIKTGNQNIYISFRKTDLNAAGAELALRGRLGDNPLISAEWYQPVDAARIWFLAPRLEWRRQEESAAFEVEGFGLQRFTFNRAQENAGADAGLTLGTWGEFRVGGGWSRVSYSDFGGSIVLVGPPPDPEVVVVDLAKVFPNYDTSFIRAQLSVDTLDNPYFPIHGSYLRTDMRHEFLEGGYTEWNTLAYTALTYRKITFSPHLQVGLSYEDKSTLTRMPFTLGGLFNVSGLLPGEVFGENAGSAAMVGYYRLGKVPKRFGTGFFVGGSLEVGAVWNTHAPHDQNTLLGGSAFLGATTLLGPLYLGVGVAEEGRHLLFLYFGRPADMNR